VTDGYTDLGDVPAGLDPEAPELATSGVGVGRFTGTPYDGIEFAVHHRGRTRVQVYLNAVAARRLAAMLTAAAGDPSPSVDLLGMAQVLAVARSAAAWLDGHNGRGQDEVTHRILKLVEEVGEIAQARIGQLGQNPRKGVTHSADDVADELVDMVVTALVALQSLEIDPTTVLTRKAETIALRLERFQHGNGAGSEAGD
jgi:NTP pyrophosphatase (non-canonical NTP hydrolase)